MGLLGAAALGLAHRWNVLDHVFGAPPADPVLFTCDFEGSGLEGLQRSGDGHAEVLPSPGGVSGHSLRLELRRDDGESRAEVVPVAVAGFHRGSYACIGHEYWYGFRVFLPASWEIDSLPESIAQWHGVPDRLLLEGDRNPALAINVIGDRYVIESRFDDRLVTDRGAIDGSGSYGGTTRYRLGSIRDDLGRWTEWRFRVRWSHRCGEGRLDVWKDGALLVSSRGANCFRDLRGGPYLKLGPYKWDWADPTRRLASVCRARTLWLDDVWIAMSTTAAPPIVAARASECEEGPLLAGSAARNPMAAVRSANGDPSRSARAEPCLPEPLPTRRPRRSSRALPRDMDIEATTFADVR